MKKIMLLICAALFMIAAAMNLHYAINNYDITKNKSMHIIVFAQGTGTGTGTGGSGNDPKCLKIKTVESMKIRKDTPKYCYVDLLKYEGQTYKCIDGDVGDECNPVVCEGKEEDDCYERDEKW